MNSDLSSHTAYAKRTSIQSSPLSSLLTKTAFQFTKIMSSFRSKKSSSATSYRSHSQRFSLRMFIFGLIIGGLVMFGTNSLFFPIDPQLTKVSNGLSVKPPLKRLDLNQEFVFPIRGKGGVETDRIIKYIIQKAEITEEVVIKGKKATTIKGRQFFILTIKITNDNNVGISINTRDYLRLSLNNSTEQIAADIHSDPIEIQPISTKTTRLGFPVDSDTSNYRIYVGEINGDKQAIDINL